MTMAAQLFWAAMVVAQQPFDLDPSFRTTLSEVYVSSSAFMPDGKLLISGELSFGGGPTQYLARLNPDGSKDNSFPILLAGGSRIVPWSDRYYVSTGGLPRRLLPSGLLDATFQHLNDNVEFSSGQGGDYHVYPDGSVVITGDHIVNVPDSGWAGFYSLIWFNNDGTLDLTRQPRQGNGSISLIVPQPDGKFILSGASTMWEGTPISQTFRVNADGTLDNSFNAAITWGEAQGITVLPDGRLIVSGLMKTESSSPDSLHLVRLMPNGDLDPSFNNLLVLRSEQFGQFLFLKHTYLPGHGIALHGNYDEVEGYQRNGLMIVDENCFLPSQPLGGSGCGAFFDNTGGIYRKGTTGMLTSPDGFFYIWGGYKGYDDGTTNDPTQAFVSRLPGFNVGIEERERNGFTLYPNPASTQLTVQVEHLPAAGEWLLRDAMGRVVVRERMVTYQQTLQLQGLASGVYLLERWSRGQRVATERVVVE